MGFELPALRREEEVALRLRSLFEKSQYTLYKMGSFEEYDLYMQNKPFLTGEDIITFTAADGRLMALKPDVTLSILKSTPAGALRRVYYNENVFRRSRQTGEYREISQMGLEYIGGVGMEAEAEVLTLAVNSLATVGDTALDLSHIELIEAVLSLFGENGLLKEQAREALRDKSPHSMLEAGRSAGLEEGVAQVLSQLAALSGPAKAALESAKTLLANLPETHAALDELETLYNKIEAVSDAVEIRLDFSIMNDADYYNGLIFTGFAKGVPVPVLAGGRYDNLMMRFDKPQGAVGFALYLDAVAGAKPYKGNASDTPGAKAKKPWLNVALPKGRMGNKVHALFTQVGFSGSALDEESRKLVFEDVDNRVRYFLVKPSDVDIYVEHGAADIGVVGKDVLLENGSDVLELLDLGFGRCRLAVAGFEGYEEDMARPLRVATKYPSVARRYYASKSRSVEIIKLHGSIELAPLVGLSDVIVDIVETGSTLKENSLGVLEEIAPSSARMISNRAAWRFKETRIRDLVTRLNACVTAGN